MSYLIFEYLSQHVWHFLDRFFSFCPVNCRKGALYLRMGPKEEEEEEEETLWLLHNVRTFFYLYFYENIRMMVCGMPKHVAYILGEGGKKKVSIYRYIKLCWTVCFSLIIQPYDYTRYQLAMNHTVSLLIGSISHADICTYFMFCLPWILV